MNVINDCNKKIINNCNKTTGVASYGGTEAGVPPLPTLTAVITARRYAERGICYGNSVCLSVRLSVRLSVCPSHGWISQKRLKLRSCNFHRTVAPSL